MTDKENTSGEKIVIDVMQYLKDNKSDNSNSDFHNFESKLSKKIDKGMNIFFEMKDKFNLSKTDIPSNVVFPLSLVIDFMIDPTPTYNLYINSLTIKDFEDGGYKFNDREVIEPDGTIIINISSDIDLEDFNLIELLRNSLKINCKAVVETFFIDTYIPALVSKDRKGRIEGKAVLHGLSELNKMVNERFFGQQNPFTGTGTPEVDHP